MKKMNTWKRKGKLGKIWGILGALWLVMVCLAGCVVSMSGDNGNPAAQNAGMAAAGNGEQRDVRTEAESESKYESGPGIEENQETAGSEETKGKDKETEDEEEIEDSEEHIEEEKSKKPEEKEEAENNVEEGRKSEGGIEGKGSEEETNAADKTENSVSKIIPEEETQESLTLSVEESGTYTSKDEVALYLHLYGHLPDNYITKQEAEQLGWNNKEGNLWEVAPGKSIGGNRFGNYEGALPDVKGRKYFECDIDFDGGYRGAKRLIYSNDGFIYYTEDHYNTFEQLYGE